MVEQKFYEESDTFSFSLFHENNRRDNGYAFTMAFMTFYQF